MSTSNQPGVPGGNRRSALPFIVLGVLLVVGVAIALLASGGDNDSDDVATGDGDTTESAGDEEIALLATGGVTVRGEGLPALPDDGEDPAIGSPAPTLEGVTPTGQGTAVDYDGPTLIAFLAHWCPHCQAELPELVELADEGGLDGIDTVAVLTGTDETAPNYPPAPWLEREGWSGRVLLDDELGTAADAFALTSYPYLVLVDEDGNVVDRNAGALGLERLRDFVAQVG